MLKMRKSKQINLDCIEELSAKYGTMDKNSPDVLYIRAKGRITPLLNKSDYSKDVTKLKNKFNTVVENNIEKFKDYFDNEKYIYSIDISEKGISFKKGSYIKFDIYVKPKEKKDIIEYNDIISDFLININNELKQILSDIKLIYITKTRPRL